MGCSAAGEMRSCAKRNVPKLLLALVKAECISSSERSEYLVTSVDDSFLGVTALEGEIGLSKCLIHRLDPSSLITGSEGDLQGKCYESKGLEEPKGGRMLFLQAFGILSLTLRIL